jgi:outer membrane protein assembly factor BamD (BamD/ComL family)
MTASAANKRLDEAREALARHDLSSARAGIDEVLAGAPGRREQAEAFTLRAESALVAGDLAAAAAGYAFVAERFEGLPAAENALFAAARIDADRLRGPAAAKGLEQYLSRYPNGRFVKEAASRLRDLRARSGSDP